MRIKNGTTKHCFFSIKDQLSHKIDYLSSTVAPKTQLVFEKIIDVLLFVWLTLQYAYVTLISDLLPDKKIFKKEIVLCRTSNHGKFSDLRDYVLMRRRTPLKVEKEDLEIANRYGFTPGINCLSPSLYNSGNCLGNTVFFLQQWHDTRDIQSIADHFKGGSPLQGVLYQQAYTDLYLARYYPDLTKCLFKVIANYPHVSFHEASKELLKAGFTPKKSPIAFLILDAALTYLSENPDPKEGGFVKYIKARMKAKYQVKLSGKFLASLRHVEMQLTGKSLLGKDVMRAIFAFAGLKIKVHFMDCKPKKILNFFSNPKEGSYKISLPLYSSTGQLEGHHAIGIIIDAEKCYWLDSNGVVVEGMAKDIPQTLGRLFTYYTGVDFSATFEGTTPPHWKKMVNFLRQNSNPPSKMNLKNFDLIEVV